MKVKWLGHACFLIRSRTELRIITDPYEPNFRGMMSYGSIDDLADVCTVSHQHGDHSYVAGLRGAPVVVQGHGVHSARGVDFRGIGCFHDKVQGRERGPNTIFCFIIDGVHLCHLGDLGHPLPKDQVSHLGQVDVLMLPTGGPASTLEMSEALELVRNLNPRIVLPMHYKTDKCGFPKYDAADLVRESKIAREVGSSMIDISRDTLPAATEIVVLEHSL